MSERLLARGHRWPAATPVGRPLSVRLSWKCVCGKVRTTSRRDGEQLLAAVREHTGTSEPVRWYRCASGCWHWTHAVPVPKPRPP